MSALRNKQRGNFIESMMYTIIISNYIWVYLSNIDQDIIYLIQITCWQGMGRPGLTLKAKRGWKCVIVFFSYIKKNIPSIKFHQQILNNDWNYSKILILSHIKIYIGNIPLEMDLIILIKTDYIFDKQIIN